MKRLHFTPDKSLLNPFFDGYRLACNVSDTFMSRQIPLNNNTRCSECGPLDSSNEVQCLAFKMELNSLYPDPFNPFGAHFFTAKDKALLRIEVGEEELLEQVVGPLPRGDDDSSPCSLVHLDSDYIAIKRKPDAIEVICSQDNSIIAEIGLPQWSQLVWLLPTTVTIKDEGHHLALVEIASDNRGDRKAKSRFIVHHAILDLKSQALTIHASYSSDTRPTFVALHEADESSVQLIIGSGRAFDLVENDSIVHEPSSEVPPASVKIIQKWEQTNEDVTIILTSPSFDDGADFKVDFEINLIRVQLGGVSIMEDVLFAQVKPSECYWSWSCKEKELSVTLTKADSGVRWPSLLRESSPFPSMSFSFGEADALDTFDSDGLYDFTLRCFSGPEVLWEASNQTVLGTVLSTRPMRVVVRNGDDGLVYQYDNDHIEWKHVSTFPALAYVQSSKRDRRYTLISDDYAILIDASKQVYLYQRLMHGDANYLPQYLYTLESEEKVLGAAQTSSNVLLILTSTLVHVITFPPRISQ